MARRPGGEAEIRRRLSLAPGLAPIHAHKLAGLVDAESCLQIAPNNGNGWYCVCAISLRDDDRDVLASYQTSLGIGTVASVPGRNGSRPQTRWTISNKRECRVLVDLLDRHPLRSRKRFEYELWREAVLRWSAKSHGFAPGAREAVGHLANEIRARRKYRDPDAAVAAPELSDSYAPFWFAGFFSGEGCFQLEARRARITIKTRRDDRPLLEAIRDTFSIGTVRDVKTPAPWAPAAVWNVTNARSLLKGIDLFDFAPLLGRKARQYRAWRPGAKASARAIVGKTKVDLDVLASARKALQRAGAYRPPASQLPIPDVRAAARTAYLEVLSDWADSATGRLSCTAYADERLRSYPHWPQRETIARAFGSWYDALEAAGLADRAVRGS